MINVQTFVAIVEEKGYDKASKKLFCTQPTISKRIERLELDLNTKLFKRKGQSNVLTESGEVFYPYAKKISREWEQAKRKLDDLGGDASGVLRINAHGYLGDNMIPF